MDVVRSTANERIKRARRLLTDRRARASSGLFIVEGEDLVLAATERGIAPLELLHLEDAEPPAVPAGSGPIVPVEAGVLRQSSTLGYAARVMAVYHVSTLPKPSDDDQLAVELHGVGDPGNVGTILRALAALGPGRLGIAPGTADPLSPKATRASMGAVFSVPFVIEEDDAVALTGARRIALDVKGEVDLPDAELDGPIAFLVGAERDGLPDDVLEGADVVCRIPQSDAFDSLNAAMAATIALYELRRRGTGA